MERLTDVCWRNFDPWECCGQDHYCQRGCNDEGGCTNGCIVPKLYARLAAYEDTGLMPDDVTDLMAAHGVAIEKLADYRMREEKKAPKCYSPDIGGECRYQVYDGDDEPIDKCKRCPLCHVDKRRHQLPPTNPLTLEELRSMAGEPVWVKCLEPGMGHLSCWGIRNSDCVDGYHTNYCDTDYGKGWLAYRRKLEEV